MFILCKKPSTSFWALMGAIIVCPSACVCPPLSVDGLLGSEKLGVLGVVGVALRDFAVGNTGNAQSCGSGRSGDGGLYGSGAVALLGGMRNGDFRPLPPATGVTLRELVAMLDLGWDGKYGRSSCGQYMMRVGNGHMRVLTRSGRINARGRHSSFFRTIGSIAERSMHR